MVDKTWEHADKGGPKTPFKYLSLLTDIKTVLQTTKRTLLYSRWSIKHENTLLKGVVKRPFKYRVWRELCRICFNRNVWFRRAIAEILVLFESPALDIFSWHNFILDQYELQ